MVAFLDNPWGQQQGLFHPPAVWLCRHAEGTASAAELVCIAQVSANAKGGSVNNDDTML